MLHSFLIVYVFFGRYDSHDQGMNYMLCVVAYIYPKICLPNFQYYTICIRLAQTRTRLSGNRVSLKAIPATK